jgi:hypothetical protein
MSFSISYWDLIKFPSFADTIERGDSGWKQAQREGEDSVTLQITLVSICDVQIGVIWILVFTSPVKFEFPKESGKPTGSRFREYS